MAAEVEAPAVKAKRTITAYGARQRFDQAKMHVGFASEINRYRHFVDIYALPADRQVVDTYPGVLGSLDRIQNYVGRARTLEFPEVPKSLTTHVITAAKDQNLTLLAVPTNSRSAIFAALREDPESPLRKLYGDYLKAAVNGAAPVDTTGHYVLIDESGPKTALASLLDIEDLDTIDPKTLAQKIKDNGKNALSKLGIKSGAYIGVMTLEEAMLSSALGDNKVYGVTSTANHTPNGETNGHIVVTEKGLEVMRFDGPVDPSLRPRLVIRFGAHNKAPDYIKPPFIAQPAEPEPVPVARRTSPAADAIPWHQTGPYGVSNRRERRDVASLTDAELLVVDAAGIEGGSPPYRLAVRRRLQSSQ